MAKKSRAQRKAETAKRIAKEKLNAPLRKPHNKPTEVPYKLTDVTVQVEQPKLKTTELRIPETYIVKAAVRDNETGEIFYLDLCDSHCNIASRFFLFEKKTTDGFLDNHGEFHDRVESGRIAYEAGQCSATYRDAALISTAFRHIVVR